MTNRQIARIKRNDVVRDRSGREWVARSDAWTPERDTVNSRASLLSTDPDPRGVRRVHILTCNSVEF